MKQIDLTGKCGSCWYFCRIEGTARGECRKFPYGDNVYHDPKHQYFAPAQSRPKCKLYRAKPPSNADRIRAMSDEELAEILHNAGGNWYTVEYWTKWLKSPVNEEVRDG